MMWHQRENRPCVAKVLVVGKRIFFILRLWFACHVLPTNVSYNIPHIVVFPVSDLAAPSDDDFVAASAKVLFIMNEEIFAPLKPAIHFRCPPVVRNTDLYTFNCQDTAAFD